ncbi:MAG TPA: UDP-2,3-diacylglucosamine diphosphatase [Gammaproteobacteria bacterium]|nr:UDP-2,3-diacylglucosamine diphosphatase [Gammaproteobacteria bacterium]
MSVLFISDLHLEGRRPETIRRFLDFISERARHAEALYVLGDLFEAWIGDDDTDAQLKPVIAALAELHKAGVAVSVMHGNRDFLLGRRFQCATGCRLLGDYETVSLGGEPLLLCHGDLLCTDDEAYMTLRKTVRDPAWQRSFLAKPLGERRAMAEHLRNMSRAETAEKPEDIMDVNQTAVEAALRRFNVRRLLHGHTHRPATHEFDVDGERATRMVLGAWHEAGNAAIWDPESGLRFETF